MPSETKIESLLILLLFLGTGRLKPNFHSGFSIGHGELCLPVFPPALPCPATHFPVARTPAYVRAYASHPEVVASTVLARRRDYLLIYLHEHVLRSSWGFLRQPRRSSADAVRAQVVERSVKVYCYRDTQASGDSAPATPQAEPRPHIVHHEQNAGPSARSRTDRVCPRSTP